MLEIFKILNIEKTKNKMEIKEAYLNKLNETNPEDKPEEFMKLREAYEKAMEYADIEDEVNEVDDENREDTTEIGIWLKKVAKVYNNFKDRNDLDKWKELLNDDICQGIDTKYEAREGLLEYFMENYFLPSKVIRLLNENFNFIEDLDVLYEIFPKSFIDNVIISGIEYDEYPNYSLFKIEEDKDYNGFLRELQNLNTAFREQDSDAIDQVFEKLKDYKIDHPELDRKEAVFAYNLGEFDKAWEIMESAQKKYTYLGDIEELDFGILKAKILFEKGDYENSKLNYLDFLEKEPKNLVAIRGLCEIYKLEGKFLEARDLITNIYLNGYKDEYTDDMLKNIDDAIIEDFEHKCEDEIKNMDKQYLAQVSYIYSTINENIDRAKEVTEYIGLSDDTDILYYSSYVDIFIGLNELQKASEYLDLWEKSIENSSDEKLSKIRDKYTKKYQIYSYRAFLYILDKKEEEAIKYLDYSLKNMPNNINVLFMKAQVLFSCERYEDVIKISDEILKNNPTYMSIHMAKIQSLYKLNLYNDTFEACDNMIYENKYYIFPYRYKIKILLEVGEFEDARELIEYLHSEEVEDIDIDYFEAVLVENEEGRKKAKPIYKALINRLEENEQNMEFPEDLYLSYVECIFYDEDSDENLIEYCDKGLEYDEKNEGLIYYKALDLYYKDELDEAIKLYEYLNEIHPENRYSNDKLGDIYREKGDNKKALEYYNRQIALGDDIEDYYKRVMVNFNLLNLTEIYEDLVYLEKYLPDNPWTHQYFGDYYNILDDMEKSYKYYITAYKILEESEEYEVSPYIAYSLGLVCGKMGKIEEAINYYMKCYQLTGDIDDLERVYNKYVEIGDFDKAKEILAMEGLSKLSSKHFYRMGHINWEMRNIKEAIKYFSLIRKPDNKIKKEKARIFYYTGNLKKAAQLIEDVILDLEYQEDNRDNYLVAARIYLELGEYEKAKKYANKVIINTPICDIDSKADQRPFIYEYLGNAYTILGEYEKAEEYLLEGRRAPRCAMCDQIKCSDILYSLAYLKYIQGDFNMAKYYIEESLKIDKSLTDSIGLLYKMGILD